MTSSSGAAPARLRAGGVHGRGVRKVSGTKAALTITRIGAAGTGRSCHGLGVRRSRRYKSGAQAEAFQYMLDRLQALNLIAWVRDSDAIHITASGEFDLEGD